MRLKPLAGALAAVLIVGGTAMLAAPAQQTTLTPGQMTEAHVWVQNRGRREAVPVDLQEANLDNPLRVRIVNGEQGQAPAIIVRVTVPLWEYKLITVPTGQDLPLLLTAQGSNGWETTGTVSTAADGSTVFLLKRPH
jgi:hypothetical protein